MLSKNTVLRSVGRVVLGSALLVLAAGTPTLEAKDKAEKDRKVRPHVAAVDVGALEKAIFGEDGGGDTAAATCTADCGNGTGWQCTGESVSCEDGVGCTAAGGGKIVRGVCET